ncbi:hypothetical protein RvY_05727-4 [Ramazzottius varieornatus]|uniref:Uncharacterized protein n=1 Tax=Ramazzottius varieornatus TaxID=947166 RepID=A0A1D1V2P1_RAMVA|nr:hypothetical protein RvY_05727-4 [Ramazzottius varieornatus]
MQEARANLLPTVFLLTAFGLLKANSEYSNFLNTVLEKNGHAAFENQEHREREEPCGEYRGSCLAYAQPEEECHVQYSGYTAVIYRFEHPCFHQAGHIRSRQENPAGIFWYLARKYYEAGDFDLPMSVRDTSGNDSVLWEPKRFTSRHDKGIKRAQTTRSSSNGLH